MSADVIIQEYVKILFKTACFRAGCITGVNHAGATMVFCIFSETSIKKKLPNNRTVKMLETIYRSDLVVDFGSFIKPKFGKIYNIGGGSFSNCSVLEANIDFAKKIIYKNKKILLQKA